MRRSDIGGGAQRIDDRFGAAVASVGVDLEQSSDDVPHRVRRVDAAEIDYLFRHRLQKLPDGQFAERMDAREQFVGNHSDRVQI